MESPLIRFAQNFTLVNRPKICILSARVFVSGWNKAWNAWIMQKIAANNEWVKINQNAMKCSKLGPLETLPLLLLMLLLQINKCKHNKKMQSILDQFVSFLLLLISPSLLNIILYFVRFLQCVRVCMCVCVCTIHIERRSTSQLDWFDFTEIITWHSSGFTWFICTQCTHSRTDGPAQFLVFAFSAIISTNYRNNGIVDAEFLFLFHQFTIEAVLNTCDCLNQSHRYCFFWWKMLMLNADAEDFSIQCNCTARGLPVYLVLQLRTEFRFSPANKRFQSFINVVESRSFIAL